MWTFNYGRLHENMIMTSRSETISYFLDIFNVQTNNNGIYTCTSQQLNVNENKRSKFYIVDKTKDYGTLIVTGN